LIKIHSQAPFYCIFFLISLQLLGCDSSTKSKSSPLKSNIKSRDLSKFEIFDTSEAANLHAQEHNSGYRVIKEPSARRVEVEAALEKMFLTYQKEYPDETLGLPIPKLVLYDSSSSEARMGSVDGKMCWYVFVGSGILNSKFSNEAIMSLFAHEVTHGVQQGDNWSVEKFFFARGREEPLGAFQADDPVARKLGDAWISDAIRVGAISHLETNGLPTGASASIYPLFLKELHRKYVSSNPLCDEANALQNELISVLNKSFSVVEMEYDLVNSTKIEFEKISKKYRDSLSCVSDKTSKFSRDLTQWVGIPFLDYVNINIGRKSILQSFEADIALADGAENSIEGLFLVSEKIQLEMRRLEENPQFKDLRRYTAEDRADERSVEVMRHFSRPEALRDFFMTAYGDMLNVCSSYKIPPYGNLNDVHHGICYRMNRIQAYAAYLSK
jgi:hypothetical protein